MEHGNIPGLPELVGRDEELAALRAALGLALASKGNTCLVSGEAGIGKTRLVSELLSEAEAGGATVLRGWCLPECLEPLMPVKEALRGCGMEELVAGKAPPKVLSAYLLNDAGMLFARAERTKIGMDADIFAAMLNAVSSFVGDSLNMMGRAGDAGGFSSIGHSGYTILVQSKGRLSLATVVEGAGNEFLIGDMRKILEEVAGKVDPGLIDMSGCGWVEERLKKLVSSARYEGAVTDDPRLRQENLFDNVLLGMQRKSASGAMVLFIDDLQWADPSTLGMLHYLARNTRSCRVFILATYRPEDLLHGPDGAPHPLETAMQDMNRESLFRDIRLRRLGKDMTGDMVLGALGGAGFPDDLKGRIHEETEGNPFFVLEFLRLLVEEGHVRKQDDGWVAEDRPDQLHLPSKMFDVIRRRLNRLPKPLHQTLEFASVVGERFGSDILCRAMGTDRISLLRNLDEIERGHRLVISGDGMYRFEHCKIRDVLYSGIGEELRAEYHRIVACGYEELFSGREAEASGELARHFLAANDPRAAGYLVIAADRAREEYANDEAIRLYNLALDMVDDPAERGRMAEHLGELYSIAGDCDRSIAAYTDAVALAQGTDRKADLHKMMAYAFERHCDYESGIAAARAGLEIVDDTDSPAICGLLEAMSLNHIKQGDYGKALELLHRAMLDAARLGMGKETADAHRLLGITWWFRGDYDRALEHYQQALVVHRDIGDDRGRVSTLNNIGVVYMETGRLDEAIEYFKEGLEYEENVGDKSGMASAIDNIGNALHTKGDAQKALEYQLRALELYRMSGDRSGIAWSLSSLGYTYPQVGQVGKGTECFQESIGICKEIGDRHILIYCYFGLADTYAEAGEVGKAREFAELSLALSREVGAKREEGASMYVMGVVLREEGRYGEAMDTFERARAILAEVGDSYLGSVIDYDAGLCLKSIGDLKSAGELLERAGAAFGSMGAELWVKKVKAALADMP